jgi:hypothetical protein
LLNQLADVSGGLLTGAFIFNIMRALCELLMYRPVTGSSAEYAREFLGPAYGVHHRLGSVPPEVADAVGREALNAPRDLAWASAVAPGSPPGLVLRTSR